MSRLVDFYHGRATDSEGRLLAEIWDWDDEELEMVHDFIQWLFPLPEPSQFNADAPRLTVDDIAAFQDDAILRGNLLRSLERMLAFLGLRFDDDGSVVEGPVFAARAREVWEHRNHNWLRVTRILRSMTLLGLPQHARALYQWLELMYRCRRYPIEAGTFRYWTRAVQETSH